MEAIVDAVKQAGAEEKLLPGTVENLTAWLTCPSLPAWAQESLLELVTSEAWEELNNRFYKHLAFGTGGMRDRTVGWQMTAAEEGTPGPLGTPAHPAVGTSMLNDFNIVRGTVGLFRYCDRYLRERHGRREVPRLVIAHDARHFSRHFCELAASTWTRLGGYAMIFGGPRSTPMLSFSVREHSAHAGVVITASHNPPTDNGFKVYFGDGAQVVSPHAEGIIHEAVQLKLDALTPHLEVALEKVVTLPDSIDAAYQKVLDENVLAPEILREAGLKVVFTPIHGVGAVAGVEAMERFGVDVGTVVEQMKQDPRFPTVKSPNPENPAALAMALAQAEETGAALVLATDPDADRLGVAARNAEGKLELLTGNQTGALLAEYRLRQMKAKGWLPANGSPRAAVIKTFVTTPLQDAIGKAHGCKVLNTLTGFKWIGDKLLRYEKELVDKVREADGVEIRYDGCDLHKRRELLLQHSTFYAFGGEESYGYLASDRVRDKDAHAALLMVCEMAAWLAADGKTLFDFLDELHLRYGFHLEQQINIYYEGASGAAKIRNILESYRAEPPKAFGDYRVTDWKDFGTMEIMDDDGERIPPQDFYFLTLDNGYQYAVRGSGTEPKIKFYFFAREDVPEPAALPDTQQRTHQVLAQIKDLVEADARERAG